MNRDELKQTAAEVRKRAEEERLSRELKKVTSGVPAARDEAAKNGKTNVVLLYFYPSFIVGQEGVLYRTKEIPDFPTDKLTGLTKAFYDWCVEDAKTSDVTVKIVSLGLHWIDAHQTHVLGITMDWADEGEEQEPYLDEPLRLTY